MAGTEAAEFASRFGRADDMPNSIANQLGLGSTGARGHTAQSLSVLIGEVDGCLAHTLRRVPRCRLRSAAQNRPREATRWYDRSLGSPRRSRASEWERYTFYTLQFEFDAAKSSANKAKHGIDFDEAKELWNDETRMEIPARTTGESRLMVIGRISGAHWSAVITYRGETTRIISVRRSRREEVELYEGQVR